MIPLLARAKRAVKPMTELWHVQPRAKIEPKKEELDFNVKEEPF